MMNEMNIQTATYFYDDILQRNVSIKAIIDGQEIGVPLDPANRHYAEIMRQVEAGELTIASADAQADNS